MSQFRSALVRLREARAGVDAASADLEAAKLAVQEQLTAAGVDAAEVPGVGSVSWRESKPAQRIDWEAVAREAGASAAMVAAFTTEKPGSKTFRFTPA